MLVVGTVLVRAVEYGVTGLCVVPKSGPPHTKRSNRPPLSSGVLKAAVRISVWFLTGAFTDVFKEELLKHPLGVKVEAPFDDGGHVPDVFSVDFVHQGGLHRFRRGGVQLH